MFSSNTSQVVATSTQAEAVDFDGTNDYLTRASNLTGNTNNKTFTFSAWVWSSSTSTSATTIYSAYDPSSVFTRFQVGLNGNQVRVLGYDTSNNLVLQASGTLLGISKANTFYHVLFSMDMANEANRSIYVNDVSVLDSVAAYVNSNIGFATSTHYVGALAGTPTLGARFSNVYFDKTYRDMSITANRRLFITADLKPAAGQAALNPILYLPMSDPTTVGTNAGTGGNFTLTGTVARSGRGPNQYNAPYSDLDGSADYLMRDVSTSSSTSATLVFAIQPDAVLGSPVNVYNASFTTSIFVTYFSGGKLHIDAYSGTSTPSLLMSYTSNTTFVVGRNYVIAISFNLTSSATRHVYINGVSDSGTWSTYNNGSVAFGESGRRTSIGNDPINYGYFSGKIGAVWFRPGSYIDLSVASNLAKFVSGTGIDAKPVDLGATGELPTGTSPVVYLPMYGNNAGKNYGTGGDFTVNSGPYTGARGPNEFWGNKANFGATASNYLSRSTALVGNPGSVTTATFCCYFYCNNAATTGTLFGFESAASGTWQISANRVFVWLGSGYVEFNENVTSSAWHSLLFSRTGSTITAYLDGAALTINSGGSFGYGGAINFALTPVNIGVRKTGASTSDPMNGQISELYLSSSYIDFSQEANRLKFRDCFGNPVDLSAQITAQSIPTPIVYARFPPTSFGTNSGTGGDFTVTGTITDGGQL